MPRLGIEIGGVIAPLVHYRRKLQLMPPALDAFEVARRLISRFDGVHLMMMQVPGHEARLRAWLHHWEFHERTGVRPERVHFCTSREQLRARCWEIGITHFVDKRLDVLEELGGTVAKKLWFRGKSSPISRRTRDVLANGNIVPVSSWKEALFLLDHTYD